MQVIARIGAHGSNHRFAWRGLPNINFEVRSSLHRAIADISDDVSERTIRDKEDEIIKEARKWGLGISGGHYVDDLQLLADLQHFGVPTRLIDITSNPMTALWFATEKVARSPGDARNASGILVAMNLPWYREDEDGDFPRTVFNTATTPPVTWDDFDGGLSSNRNRALKLKSPFIVSSSMPNPRLRAQEGYFISSRLPEDSSGPLGDLSLSWEVGDEEDLRLLLTEDKERGFPKKLPFIAVRIPSKTKDQIRNYLKLTYSRTARRLFPDYSGFASYGKWRDDLKK